MMNSRLSLLILTPEVWRRQGPFFVQVFTRLQALIASFQLMVRVQACVEVEFVSRLNILWLFSASTYPFFSCSSYTRLQTSSPATFPRSLRWSRRKRLSP